jgi:hypothetical protein
MTLLIVSAKRPPSLSDSAVPPPVDLPKLEAFPLWAVPLLFDFLFRVAAILGSEPTASLRCVASALADRADTPPEFSRTARAILWKMQSPRLVEPCSSSRADGVSAPDADDEREFLMDDADIMCGEEDCAVVYADLQAGINTSMFAILSSSCYHSHHWFLVHCPIPCVLLQSYPN